MNNDHTTLALTKEEIIGKVWPDSSKEGQVSAQKAIDFDNLVMTLTLQDSTISLSQSLTGLTANETRYKIVFEQNPEGNFSLKAMELFGATIPNPTKSEVTDLIESFNFDYKNAPSKKHNFTNVAPVSSFKKSFH